jgi:hypothetical protein
MSMSMSQASVGIVSVTDNWWVVRIKSTGKILSLGTWLPPECENIEAHVVPADEMAALLAEMLERAKAE